MEPMQIESTFNHTEDNDQISTYKVRTVIEVINIIRKKSDVLCKWTALTKVGEALDFFSENSRSEINFYCEQQTDIILPVFETADEALLDGDNIPAMIFKPIVFLPSGQLLNNKQKQQKEIFVCSILLLTAQSNALCLESTWLNGEVNKVIQFHQRACIAFAVNEGKLTEKKVSKAKAKLSLDSVEREVRQAITKADELFDNEVKNLLQGKSPDKNLLAKVVDIFQEFHFVRLMLVGIAGGIYNRNNDPESRGSRAYYEAARARALEEDRRQARIGARDVKADLAVIPIFWLHAIKSSGPVKGFRRWFGMFFRSLGFNNKNIDMFAKLRLIARHHDIDEIEQIYANNVEAIVTQLALKTYDEKGTMLLDFDNASITIKSKTQGVGKFAANVIHFTPKIAFVLNVSKHYPLATYELPGYICVSENSFPYYGHSFIDIASNSPSTDASVFGQDEPLRLPEMIGDILIDDGPPPPLAAIVENIPAQYLRLLKEENTAILIQQSNVRKIRGPSLRYKNYKSAVTIEEFFQAGGTQNDLSSDLANDIITINGIGSCRNDPRLQECLNRNYKKPRTLFKAHFRLNTTGAIQELHFVAVEQLADAMEALPQAMAPSQSISCWSGMTKSDLSQPNIGAIKLDSNHEVASTYDRARHQLILHFCSLKSTVLKLDLVKFPDGLKLNRNTTDAEWYRRVIRQINPYARQATPYLVCPAEAYCELETEGMLTILRNSLTVFTPHRAGLSEDQIALRAVQIQQLLERRLDRQRRREDLERNKRETRRKESRIKATEARKVKRRSLHHSSTENAQNSNQAPRRNWRLSTNPGTRRSSMRRGQQPTRQSWVEQEDEPICKLTEAEINTLSLSQLIRRLEEHFESEKGTHRNTDRGEVATNTDQLSVSRQESSFAKILADFEAGAITLELASIKFRQLALMLSSRPATNGHGLLHCCFHGNAATMSYDWDYAFKSIKDSLCMTNMDPKKAGQCEKRKEKLVYIRALASMAATMIEMHRDPYFLRLLRAASNSHNGVIPEALYMKILMKYLFGRDKDDPPGLEFGIHRVSLVLCTLQHALKQAIRFRDWESVLVIEMMLASVFYETKKYNYGHLCCEAPFLLLLRSRRKNLEILTQGQTTVITEGEDGHGVGLDEIMERTVQESQDRMKVKRWGNTRRLSKLATAKAAAKSTVPSRPYSTMDIEKTIKMQRITAAVGLSQQVKRGCEASLKLDGEDRKDFGGVSLKPSAELIKSVLSQAGVYRRRRAANASLSSVHLLQKSQSRTFKSREVIIAILQHVRFHLSTDPRTRNFPAFDDLSVTGLALNIPKGAVLTAVTLGQPRLTRVELTRHTYRAYEAIVQPKLPVDDDSMVDDDQESPRPPWYLYQLDMVPSLAHRLTNSEQPPLCLTLTYFEPNGRIQQMETTLNSYFHQPAPNPNAITCLSELNFLNTIAATGDMVDNADEKDIAAAAPIVTAEVSNTTKKSHRPPQPSFAELDKLVYSAPTNGKRHALTRAKARKDRDNALAEADRALAKSPNALLRISETELVRAGDLALTDVALDAKIKNVRSELSLIHNERAVMHSKQRNIISKQWALAQTTAAGGRNVAEIKSNLDLRRKLEIAAKCFADRLNEIEVKLEEALAKLDSLLVARQRRTNLSNESEDDEIIDLTRKRHSGSSSSSTDNAATGAVSSSFSSSSKSNTDRPSSSFSRCVSSEESSAGGRQRNVQQYRSDEESDSI